VRGQRHFEIPRASHLPGTRHKSRGTVSTFGPARLQLVSDATLRLEARIEQIEWARDYPLPLAVQDHGPGVLVSLVSFREIRPQLPGGFHLSELLKSLRTHTARCRRKSSTVGLVNYKIRVRCLTKAHAASAACRWPLDGSTMQGPKYASGLELQGGRGARMAAPLQEV
jgi:hypothetical protein